MADCKGQVCFIQVLTGRMYSEERTSNYCTFNHSDLPFLYEMINRCE